MPTYKHPCPHCDNFIDRDVRRCPFCAAIDPFAPRRCPECRAVIEDARMIACPRCGTPMAEGVAPMPAPPPIVPGLPGQPGVVGAPPPAAGSAGAIPGWGAQPPANAQVAPPSTPPAAPPPPVAAPPVAVPPVPNPSAVACSGCGAALAPGARFCTTCGTIAG